MDFVAVLTAVACWLVLDLLAAVWTSIVHHLIICKYSLHKAREFVEFALSLLGSSGVAPCLILIATQILSDTVEDLLDELEVI